MSVSLMRIKHAQAPQARTARIVVIDDFFMNNIRNECVQPNSRLAAAFIFVMYEHISVSFNLDLNRLAIDMNRLKFDGHVDTKVDKQVDTKTTFNTFS